MMEEMEEREAKEDRERILNSNEVILHNHHLVRLLANFFLAKSDKHNAGNMAESGRRFGG